MGNGPSKPEVLKKLEDNMTSAAKDYLSKEFGGASTTDATLKGYTEAIAKASFKNTFPYEWGSSCSPPHNTGKINTKYGYCFIDDSQPLSTAIGQAVKSEIGGSELSLWMKEKALADLTAEFTKHLGAHPDNAWHQGFSTHTYNATTNDADSYNFDISLTYTNATLTDSAVGATLHILYFVGVFYSVNSPTKEAYGKLRGSALSQAKNLSHVDVASIPNSDVELSAILREHTGPGYKETWHYDFGGIPPDYPSDIDGALYASNDHLCYVDKLLEPTALDLYVEQQIMKGLNIAVKSVEASVKNDIVSVFQGIISTAHSGEWHADTRIDQSYALQSGSPIRINAKVMYWYNKDTLLIDEVGGTSSKEVAIEMMFLYFIGTVYQLIPNPIEQDLVTILYKNIEGPPLPAGHGKITMDQFQGCVEAYNLGKFKKAYGFDLPEISNDKEKIWKKFFPFKSFNPQNEDIEKMVQSELFGPDEQINPRVKHGKQEAVYKFIVRYLQTCSGPGLFKADSQWYNGNKQESMKYRVNQVDWVMDVRLACAFVSATLTEHKIGTNTIEHCYLSLLIDIQARKYTEGDEEV